MKYHKKWKTYMRKIEKYEEGEDMEIGYQADIDDLAILLVKDYVYDRSKEVTADFIIDIDTEGRLVAIEVVNCSKQLGVSTDYVEKAKKEVFVEVYEFSYKIIISFNSGEKEIVQKVLK